MNQTQDLYRKAKTLIPGGTQLLSKRPEMFLPGGWPAYYDRSLGCEVWDLDGKHYVDMSYMGIGAALLGYADPDVNAAVKSAVEKGNLCTLNAPEEVDLAELLFDLHPWAEMTRYARSGGEAMAMAVRIGRARTAKDVVLFCGYHGWHDWYLASNLADAQSLDGHLLPGLSPLGVPRSLRGTSFPFAYNETGDFLALIDRHKDSVACVVMESIRNYEPDKTFLETIRQVTRDRRIVLIVDEITAGFRLNCGGAHLLFGLEPDIAVFAKGMSNGFPMAAVIGKRDVMQAAQDTFISSTYWTDRIGPTAALATIRKFRNDKVHEHLIAMGRKVQDGWTAAACRHGLPIQVCGINPLGHFSFKSPEPLVLKTIFTQTMLEQGYLATTAFYASFAHKEHHVADYLAAVDSAFAFIARGVRDGDLAKHLRGPVCHSGFRRLA